MNDDERRAARLTLDPRVQAEVSRLENRLDDAERRLTVLEERVQTIRIAEAESWEERP